MCKMEIDSVETMEFTLKDHIYHIHQLPITNYYDKCLSKNSTQSDSTGCRIYIGAHVMSQFLASNLAKDLLTNKNVLELGCGTGLVGLVCLYNNTLKKLILTDGNNNACNIAQLNISSIGLNPTQQNQIYCKQLIWNSDPQYSLNFINNENNSQPFDVILGCELMYYKTDMNQLLHTVLNLTNYNGIFIHSHVFRAHSLEKEMHTIFTQYHWNTLLVPIHTFIPLSELGTHTAWYQVCTLISGPNEVIDRLLQCHSDWTMFTTCEEACNIQLIRGGGHNSDPYVSDDNTEQNSIFGTLFKID